jgi:hypothetical protein
MALKEKCLIEVGDLVKLRGDTECILGVGIVIDYIEDCSYILESFDIFEEDFDIDMSALEGPVFLVMWQPRTNASPGRPRSLWLFAGELEIVY